MREFDLYAGVVAADVKGVAAVWNTYHDETGWHCDCPARGRCTHMLALGLIASVEPGPHRGDTMTARGRLATALAPELLAALEELIDERIASALAASQPVNDARWFTLEQAAGRLGCSPDAVRMRVKRGRLESRRQGRRLYVSAASVDGLA